MITKALVKFVAALVVLFTNVTVQADVFNMGGTRNTTTGTWTGLANLEMVTVDNSGNGGEWSGQSYGGYGPNRVCGAVDYIYQIAKYEVTAGQYAEFLNAKAKTDPYGLWVEAMGAKELAINSSGCAIQRSGASGNYTYSVPDDWANRPICYVSFWNAARFCNWLSNGQRDGDTESGAYTLNGYKGQDGRDIKHNPGATFWIPTEDEWYKAAYHKNDGATSNYWNYPTQTDQIPSNILSNTANNNANFWYDAHCSVGTPYFRTEVGAFASSPGPYGTFDQGGNAMEWNEEVVYEGTSSSSRGIRGGSYGSSGTADLNASLSNGRSPSGEWAGIGFRVASIPEPSMIISLLGLGVSGLVVYACRRYKPE